MAVTAGQNFIPGRFSEAVLPPSTAMAWPVMKNPYTRVVIKSSPYQAYPMAFVMRMQLSK
jgi:hypothetical protein